MVGARCLLASATVSTSGCCALLATVTPWSRSGRKLRMSQNEAAIPDVVFISGVEYLRKPPPASQLPLAWPVPLEERIARIINETYYAPHEAEWAEKRWPDCLVLARRILGVVREYAGDE